MDGGRLAIFYIDGDSGWICFYTCDAADGIWKLEGFEREGSQ